MDIGEVARRTGISVSALRYYESKGLIRSNARVGARRQFADSVVVQLALISLGRAAGLSLDEIARMLSPVGTLQVDRDVLRARAKEFDAEIRRLMATRDGLLHAAECKADNHLACPSFRRLLRNEARRTRVASRIKRLPLKSM